ncbi:hypothetical protein O5D80_000852 [Batrachochytrium dendrobatidis]|nr:hypothetical protein O5D80_000852 [Batrachochytrium dendrobatidis]
MVDLYSGLMQSLHCTTLYCIPSLEHEHELRMSCCMTRIHCNWIQSLDITTLSTYSLIVIVVSVYMSSMYIRVIKPYMYMHTIYTMYTSCIDQHVPSGQYRQPGYTRT